VFSSSRKSAQQTAQRLLSGHVTLIAWWALRHAGVFEAMAKQEGGLDPLVHATRTNMAPEVLRALLDYLASSGLATFKGEQVSLTAEGKALLEHEDGVLELIRAYQPVLEMSEHLLAKLKTYGPPGSIGGSGAGGGAGVGGVYRKSEYLQESQTKRFAAEVYPAVQEVVAEHRLAHLLDVACGGGDLMLYLAKKMKNIVGVGIGADAPSVRRANAAITEADLEKRFIAVAANPLDVLTETQRSFDRIGISRQLWNSFDCLIVNGVLSEYASTATTDPLAAVAKTLAATRKNFPQAHLLLIEPVSSPRFEKNYYAAELALVLRLTRSAPWTSEKWQAVFGKAQYEVKAEVGLTIDGLVVFLCKPK
jgi:2-polyprenyl-3-methyl-5-hydroxy-6-metoxy-1,4-benzoquinol methylase